MLTHSNAGIGSIKRAVGPDLPKFCLMKIETGARSNQHFPACSGNLSESGPRSEWFLTSPACYFIDESIPVPQTEHSLANFQGFGYDKGRSIIWQALWVLTSKYIIEQVWCPSKARIYILRKFGATIGDGVLMRHGVKIHWPWKLEIGNDVWIGTNAWLLNLEPIIIGSNVCISQDVMLCTGSHDRSSKTFEFDNASIVIEDSAWVAARATVLRGVTIGAKSVIGATALVTKDVPPNVRILAPISKLTEMQN